MKPIDLTLPKGAIFSDDKDSGKYPSVGDIARGDEIGKHSHFVKYIWLACSDCHNEQWVSLATYNFRIKKNNKSYLCIGCSRKGIRNHFYIHGHTNNGKFSPEYCSWTAMLARCYNPNNTKYPSYGAKGIGVCDKWHHSFEAFLEDMGSRPAGTTLDRIDNNSNYEITNCRWATPKEQARNRKPFINCQSLKTHCPHGHSYAGDNVYYKSNGGRGCRTCDCIRSKNKRDYLKSLRESMPKVIRQRARNHSKKQDGIPRDKHGHRLTLVKCPICDKERLIKEASLKRSQITNPNNVGVCCHCYINLINPKINKYR